MIDYNRDDNGRGSILDHLTPHPDRMTIEYDEGGPETVELPAKWNINPKLTSVFTRWQKEGEAYLIIDRAKADPAVLADVDRMAQAYY